MDDWRPTLQELPAHVQRLPLLQQAGCLVGIPYEAGVFDCGHLAVAAARLLFGKVVQLPGANPHPISAREMGAAIALGRREAATPVAVDQVVPGCVVLFTETLDNGGTQWHLGTVVANLPETWVLHTREGGFSMLQRMADCLRQGLHFEGFYAWR